MDYILGGLPQSFRPDMESAPTVLQGGGVLDDPWSAAASAGGAEPRPYRVVFKSAVQPSSTSRHVAEKSPVYHGSATSPGRAV